MSRALVTFATGGHEQLLQLALPGFEAYAEEHGYELLTAAPRLQLRPPAWHKVSALLDALDRHDAALWLDADVVIVDGSRDLAEDVPPGAWQALVRHHTPDGEVPNTGVWYCRAPMQEPLERVWSMTRYLDHPWWDQAAVLALLGYDPDRRPVAPGEATELLRHTAWLDLAWNSHEERDRHPSPRFAHATAGGLDWRASVMRARARTAQRRPASAAPRRALATATEGAADG